MAIKHRIPTDEKSLDPRSKFDTSPVLSGGPKDSDRKDYLAISVFVVVLSTLIIIGAYFSLNIDQGLLKQPLKLISKLSDEASQYGKSILQKIKEEQSKKNKPASRSQKHLRKGYGYLKEGKFNQALDKLNQAIETNPKNHEALFWRARTFILMKQYDDAVADLNDVVKLNPRYSPAYDTLGWVLLDRKEYDLSLSNLNKSIELKPENGWAYYMRGRVYLNKGDLQKALDSAKTACKLGNDDGCHDAKYYENRLAEKG